MRDGDIFHTVSLEERGREGEVSRKGITAIWPESVGWLGRHSIESGEVFLLGNQNVYIACQESVPLVARISQVKPGRNGTSGLPAIA